MNLKNTSDYHLIQGNCIEKLNNLAKNSVDLICVDLPYGTSRNKWDQIIPFSEMWESFFYVLKSNGNIVLTASQPFTSKLICSNLLDFKYEIIWEKTIGSNQLNIKRQPLRIHESILVFYKNFGTYNEQKTNGKPYSINRTINFDGYGYGKQYSSSKRNDGFRHAKSIIKIPNPRIKGGHPTQKPLELMKFIVKTFSNENDIVLDCCMGSGTTGEAALSLNRKFIGIELDTNYFNIAIERLRNYDSEEKRSLFFRYC